MDVAGEESIWNPVFKEFHFPQFVFHTITHALESSVDLQVKYGMFGYHDLYKTTLDRLHQREREIGAKGFRLIQMTTAELENTVCPVCLNALIEMQRSSDHSTVPCDRPVGSTDLFTLPT